MCYLVKIKFDKTFVETWAGNTILENSEEEWLLSCGAGLTTTSDKKSAKSFKTKDEADASVAICLANHPNCSAWVETIWFDENPFIALWKKMKSGFEFVRLVSRNF